MSPKPGTPGYKPSASQRLKGALRRAARGNRNSATGTRFRPEGGDVGGIRAENVVWIFATARTGSTWLGAMMDELNGQTVWREPLVGALFGNFYYVRAGHRIDKRGEHFILGRAYKETWMGPMRDMVLGGAAARFPEAAGASNYLVIKEPNGSIGAPLLMEALPESRMILLVRDPRDVVASSMDARRKGGWQYENRNKGGEKGDERRETLSDRDPDAFVRTRARSYVEHIEKAKEAYDAHEGYKVLVRYEELRADTLGTMKGLYSALEIPVDEEELAKVVEKHSWENIPEGEKGEGKFYRKASPGGWQEDLTPKQAEIVERITAPLLKELYPD